MEVRNRFARWVSSCSRYMFREHRLHFFGTLAVLVVFFIFMMAFQINLQWFWLLLYAALILPFAPYVTKPEFFFRGGLNSDKKGVRHIVLLAASASISWVFAKSILNASLLGGEFGIVGAFAYTGYYTSFASVGIVIYLIRTRQGYRSLPEAINERYGSMATLAFGLAVLFRLYQEVWSNALVVAGFYGDEHTKEWWLGACLSTAIPVIYSFTGGMRASLVTDVAQSVICIGFLLALVIVLGVNAPASFGSWNGAGTCNLAADPTPPVLPEQCAAAAFDWIGDAGKAALAYNYTAPTCSYGTITSQDVCTSVGGTWMAATCQLLQQRVCTTSGGNWQPRKRASLEGGMDLLVVALMQGTLSYPFFDPVLTDRAFLASPKAMLISFMLAGIISGLFIFLFSFMGIFGNMVANLEPTTVAPAIYKNMLAGNPTAVSKYFGTAMYSVTNIIFITESLSTLDSTFTSAAKLLGPEFLGILEIGQPQPPQTANKRHLRAGRIIIIILAVIGILPLLANPTALNATTVSGTLIMGLGPPVWFLIFIKGYRPLTFHIPFWWGIGMGVVFQLSTASCCKDYINVRGFAFGSGENNTLLGFNVIGTAIAWGLAGLTLLENSEGSNLIVAAAQGNNVVKLIQKLLKPLDRVLGGKFDKSAAANPNMAVEGGNFDMSAVKENAAFEERLQRDQDSGLAV
ncbi:hypothetical protein ABBQ32_006269 [Trebouxia sp. C0010 RCD-2024]